MLYPVKRKIDQFSGIFKGVSGLVVSGAQHRLLPTTINPKELETSVTNDPLAWDARRS